MLNRGFHGLLGQRPRGHCRPASPVLTGILLTALFGSLGWVHTGLAQTAEFRGYAPEIWQGVREGDVVVFKGLPYAAPPVAERRWMPPAAYQPSAGHRRANGFAPACMQGPHTVNWYQALINSLGKDPSAFSHPEQGYSEDCLYLNVWTPAMQSGSGLQSDLPVMVWIHGGSNKGGWPFEPDYIGQALAAQGVVVISVAYRVGIFGFFAHPELQQDPPREGQANYALLDLLAALSWVKQHVSEFGGDPENITLFGESAGAANIGYLLSAPAAAGLFDKVIHQSAGFQMRESLSLAEQIGWGRQLSTALDTDLKGLRALSGTALMAATNRYLPDLSYAPAVGGAALPRAPAEVFAAGQQHQVPAMLGTNANEWLMYLEPDQSLDVVLDELQLTEFAADIDAQLGGLSTPFAMDRLYTAQQMLCPTYAMADAISQQDQAWVYQFTRVREGAHWQSVGAYHGAEIPYVFGTHADWLETRAADNSLTKVMQRYWINFATTGSPNADALPVWPKWVKEQPQVVLLDQPVELQAAPDLWLCALLGRGLAEHE